MNQGTHVSFLDRMLAGTERILPLLRKRLEMAGYDDDELTTIAGEDLGHIFKLIVRDVTWRADVSVISSSFNSADPCSSLKSPHKLPIRRL
jgi:hypothetical protein